MEWRYLLLLTALVTIQSGCRSFKSDIGVSPFEKITAGFQGDRSPEDENNQTANTSAAEAVKMVVIWKENILQTDSGRPKQGFTGRAYFHDADGAIVKVQGELNVYGYDDSGNMRKQVPDKHFVFEAKDFESHYSPNELGHSYTFWLPWCDYGGLRKMITLVPVFKSSTNKIVEGSADYLTLAGDAPTRAGLERTIASPPPPTMTNEQYAFAAHRRAAEQSISVPESIKDQWGNTNAMQTSSQLNTFPKPNPVTMNLMDMAEQRVEGYRPNEVRVSRQTINTAQTQVQQYPAARTSEVVVPNQNWPARQARPDSRRRPQGITASSNDWNYHEPAMGNRPMTRNVQQTEEGVHAALSDMAPVSTPTPNRVFGQPGSVR